MKTRMACGRWLVLQGEAAVARVRQAKSEGSCMVEHRSKLSVRPVWGCHGHLACLPDTTNRQCTCFRAATSVVTVLKSDVRASQLGSIPPLY